MSRISSIFLSLTVFANVAFPAPPVEVRAPRTDSFGDPLPRGAIARLGTNRWKGSETMGALAFSPDGKMVAAACNDSCLRLWQFPSGLVLREYQLCNPEQVSQMVFAADMKKVSLGGFNTNRVRFLDLHTGKIDVDALEIATGSAIVSQNGKWALSLSNDGFRHQLTLLKMAEPNLRREIGSIYLKNQPATHRIALSPDGRWAAYGVGETDGHGLRGHFYLFDTVLGRTWTSPLFEPVGDIRLIFAPDNKSLAIGSDKQLVLWELESKSTPQKSFGIRSVCHFQKPFEKEGFPKVVCFSPDGKYLIGGDINGTIILWDARTGKVRRTRNLNLLNGIAALAISPDSTTFAVTTENDSCIRLFDLSSGRELFTENGHRGAVSDLAFLPSGKALASCCTADGSIRTWDLTPVRSPISITAKSSIVEDRIRSREFARVEIPRASFVGVAFADEGRLLFGTQISDVIAVWETGKLDTPREIHLENTERRFTNVSPDGSVVAIALPESGLQLIDSKTELPLKSQPQLRGIITDMIFSPDSTTFGAITATDGFQFFEVATGKQSKANFFVGKGTPRYLAAKSVVDQTIQIWDCRTGRLARRIDGVNSPCSLSPDGRYLASHDGAIFQIREVATGQIVATGRNGNETVTSIRYSPDGSIIAVGYGNGTILLWDVRAPLEKLAGPIRPALLWDDLADVSATKAFVAIGALTASPKEAMALLKEKLKQDAPADPKQVAQWLAELSHPRYAVREKATRKLENIVDRIEPLLLKEQVKADVETANRIEKILLTIPVPLKEGYSLRSIRCIEILERIATPDARELLEKLAGGVGHSAREARDSLERLRASK